MYIPLRVRNAEKPLLHNANRNLCIFFRNIAIPKKSAVFRETAIDTLTKISFEIEEREKKDKEKKDMKKREEIESKKERKKKNFSG